MAKLTTAQITLASGAEFTVDATEIVLNSKNEYGEAFSAALDHALGTPDPKIFGSELTRKVMHVAGVIGFYVGNTCAVKAMRMQKRPGMFGLLY